MPRMLRMLRMEMEVQGIENGRIARKGRTQRKRGRLRKRRILKVLFMKDAEELQDRQEVKDAEDRRDGKEAKDVEDR